HSVPGTFQYSSCSIRPADDRYCSDSPEVRRQAVMKIAAFVAAGGLALTGAAPASTETPKQLPSPREPAEVQKNWFRLRIQSELPRLMRKHGVNLWLVVCREYNEDPVFFSLVSPTIFAARRRTIFVFFDRGEERGVERLALGGGSNGGLYNVYRDSEAGSREIY